MGGHINDRTTSLLTGGEMCNFLYQQSNDMAIQFIHGKLQFAIMQWYLHV